MDELVNANLQDYSIVGAAIVALSTFVYKMVRVVKRDNKEDDLGDKESEFRTMLLGELKTCKEMSSQLLVEKAELKSEIAKLKEQVASLLGTLRKAGVDMDSSRYH